MNLESDLNSPPYFFPLLLKGRLWHTTNPQRFKSILEKGFILPNPPIPDEERWKTSRGPEYYPYVRKIGGVSLFDFENFESEEYSENYPMSSWYTFVPNAKTRENSVWIEIDRIKIAENFINGKDLLLRLKSENALKNTIMPYIESAHLGPLSTDSFISAHVYIHSEKRFEPINLQEPT